jgi:hypothetical protein
MNPYTLALGLALAGCAHTKEKEQEEIEKGKDFIQIREGPFDLDLIFAPDGIETFKEAYQRSVEIEGIPVCHIDDIIRSKEATGRIKDRESLPRLKAFRDWWLKNKQSIF